MRILLRLLLAGCADPVLTKEQEANFRENCQEGCAVVPFGIWQKIVERLKGQSI